MTVPSWLRSPQVQEALIAEARARGLIDALSDPEIIPAHFHEGQRAVMASDADDIVALAGTQGGKTEINAYWLLREIRRTAPLVKELGYGRYIYGGPTLTLMEQQAIPLFRKLFEEELKLGRMIMGGKPVCRFSKEGSRRLLGFEADLSVHFPYLNDPSNVESITALAAVCDEIGQPECKESAFEAVDRRLTIARSKGFGRRLMTTTPYEHGWFKRRVVEGGFAKVFNWPSWENPLVSEAACRTRLDQGMPLWRWQMMYLGLYTKPAGIIYDVYNPDRHVLKGFKIAREWPRYYGLDFGSKNICCVMMAQHPVTRIAYVYSVYYPQETRHASAHVEKIIKKGGCSPVAAVGGSASEDDARLEFSAAGLPVIEPLITGVEAQIDRVWGALANGLLYILECDETAGLRDEIERYAWELDDAGEPIPGKIQDKAKFHRLDALRYVVASLFPTAGETRVQNSLVAPEKHGVKPIERRLDLGGRRIDEATIIPM